MNFLKNKKTALALTLCAVLLAGAQMVQAAPAAETGKLYNVTSKTPATLEGTVEEFAVDTQGRTVLQVRKTGAAKTAPLIQVTLDKKTDVSGAKDIANGSIVVIEYTGKESTKIVAKSVVKTMPLPTVTEVGTVMELIAGGQGADGGFRLRPNKEVAKGTDPGANDIIFRYGADTDMGIAAKDIKVGSQLVVTYNGILTRSLPPQGFASVVADLNAPVVMPVEAK